MDAFAKLLIKTSRERDSRVILNADAEGWSKLEAFLNENRRAFAAVKVHPETPLIWGMTHEAALKALRRATGNIPVILDAKLADIDVSNSRKARFYFNKGYDALTAHAFQGKEAVRPIIELSRKLRRGVFLVAGMTSAGNLFTAKQTEETVEIVKELGATGVIAPGNDYVRLAMIRKQLGHDKLILSPGIGVQGGDANKVLLHSDFVMIGRSILGRN